MYFSKSSIRCCSSWEALFPPLTTAYAIVAERERRSLELLVSLPVSVSEVLAAKLIAVLIVTALVGLPYVAIVTALLMVVGIAGPSVIPGLIVPFVAAVVCSISASLLVTLLARDYRSADNLSGAFIVPVLVLSGIVVATFGGVARTACPLGRAPRARGGPPAGRDPLGNVRAIPGVARREAPAARKVPATTLNATRSEPSGRSRSLPPRGRGASAREAPRKRINVLGYVRVWRLAAFMRRSSSGRLYS